AAGCRASRYRRVARVGGPIRRIGRAPRSSAAHPEAARSVSGKPEQRDEGRNQRGESEALHHGAQFQSILKRIVAAGTAVLSVSAIPVTMQKPMPFENFTPTGSV